MRGSSLTEGHTAAITRLYGVCRYRTDEGEVTPRSGPSAALRQTLFLAVGSMAWRVGGRVQTFDDELHRGATDVTLLCFLGIPARDPP